VISGLDAEPVSESSTMGGPISKAAKLGRLARASVPVAYVQLGLQLAEELGVPRPQLLDGLGIDPALLERPDGRLGLLKCARLFSRVWRRTGSAALGYEFGLRCNLASHGNLGYGLLSHGSFGESLDFALKYGSLRNPLLKLELYLEGDQAVVEVREALPLGRMRQHAIDAVLIAMARLGRQLSGSFKPQVELRFTCAEPPHYARFRHRLPPVVFRARANQLRFPAEYLQRPMHTGNALAAQAAVQQCDREMQLIAEVVATAERVRALLADAHDGYPDLDRIARRLHVSQRTLKRRLHEEGWSFLQLLDEARERDSLRLLGDAALSIGDVAERMGYTNPASFTRAFRKWAGMTPSEWRDQAWARTAATVH
jgi:AraC-like DNA-binding protein